MKCPYCKSEQIKVEGHYRYNVDDDRVIRYRKCLSCGKNFRTVEEYVEDEFVENKWIPIPYQLDYESDAVCPNCGEAVVAGADYPFCPYCGSRNKGGTNNGCK